MRSIFGKILAGLTAVEFDSMDVCDVRVKMKPNLIKYYTSTSEKTEATCFV